MTTTNIIRFICALGFAASTAVWAGSDPAAPAVENRHVVVVTYFMTDVRCKSCRKIEALTRQTLQNRFANELADGSLQFRTINIDRPENAHYIDSYELSFKTVVVSDMNGDAEARWVRMDNVWQLLGKPDKFEQYIADAVSAYVGKTE
jgi:hypothetical protein